MKNKKIRLAISCAIVLLTIVVFWVYFSSHRNLLKQLGHTSIATIASVFILYFVMLGALLLVLDASIKICFKNLGKRENFILNAYTLLINFFIPGQGGPVFRGIYLKKRHSIKYRNYITVTLLYYLIYGVIALFLVLLGSRPWWQTTVATVGFIAIAVLAAYVYSRRKKIKDGGLDIQVGKLTYLLLATLAQAIIQIVIYAVELHSANRHIVLRQVITYTGAANLALFVALTPGAIGIREAFLVFTEKLHHISSANIVVANVIDRSVYLVFLISVAIILSIISFRSKDKTITELLPKRLSRKLQIDSPEV